ncbi:hypothetical protein D3C75_971600 [compost metagenome]
MKRPCASRSFIWPFPSANASPEVSTTSPPWSSPATLTGFCCGPGQRCFRCWAPASNSPGSAVWCRAWLYCCGRSGCCRWNGPGSKEVCWCLWWPAASASSRGSSSWPLPCASGPSKAWRSPISSRTADGSWRSTPLTFTKNGQHASSPSSFPSAAPIISPSCTFWAGQRQDIRCCAP